MKLTKQQKQVLAILADGKVHETSTATYVAYGGKVVIAGTVAAALVRRGFVKHVLLDKDNLHGGFGVQITAEGKRVNKDAP